MADGPIKITWDDSFLNRKLTDVENRMLPYAVAGALTKTAQEIRAVMRSSMPAIFDRPTPFTLGSIYITPANKAKLQAQVWIKDFAAKGTPAVKYLAPEVFGGGRNLKRSERALQSAGILPPGMMTVIGQSGPLDAYGNLRGSIYTRMLSQLKANPDPYQNETDRSVARRKRKRGPQYFVATAKRGGLKPGIYQRGPNRTVIPILLFVRAVQYPQRFKFFDIASRVYGEVFPDHFRKQWDLLAPRFGAGPR